MEILQWKSARQKETGKMFRHPLRSLWSFNKLFRQVLCSHLTLVGIPVLRRENVTKVAMRIASSASHCHIATQIGGGSKTDNLLGHAICSNHQGVWRPWLKRFVILLGRNTKQVSWCCFDHPDCKFNFWISKFRSDRNCYCIVSARGSAKRADAISALRWSVCWHPKGMTSTP